jgi:cephalosporin-C deacetylase-like acetyl esterase
MTESSTTAWRREQLVNVGYSDWDAETLATRADVDLHVAVGLVAHGCPPALALRILL